MEMYLCHNVIFRLLERLGLLSPFGNDLVNYIVLAVVIIAGAALFSMIINKMISIAGAILRGMLRRRSAGRG